MLYIGGKKADTSVLVLAEALITIFIHSASTYGVTLPHTIQDAGNTGNKPDKSLCPSKDYILARGERQQTKSVSSAGTKCFRQTWSQGQEVRSTGVTILYRDVTLSKSLNFSLFQICEMKTFD